MNPAQRAKRLQAHNLRCQGLTYRQIGQRMNCAHSTAAGYVRDFETHRAEIIESLAADLLVHSVAALQHPDPDLHAQHINAARELRLLVNSLDQVEDRRQKRDRRIAMEQEADALKTIEATGELLEIMRETGIHDLTPYIESATKTSPSDPPSDPLSDPLSLRERARVRAPLSPRSAGDDPVPPPLSPRCAGGDAEGRGGSPAFPNPNSHPSIPDHPRPTPAQTRPPADQSRTNPSKIEQDRTTSPAIPRKTRQITLQERENPSPSPGVATIPD